MSDDTHIVCEVETHVVVAIPVTIWWHRTDGYVIDFGDPEVEAENPFPSDGAEIYDRETFDWLTPNQLSDNYDVPVDVAITAAIGPRLNITKE
jgi:hypothetical protein